MVKNRYLSEYLPVSSISRPYRIRSMRLPTALHSRCGSGVMILRFLASALLLCNCPVVILVVSRVSHPNAIVNTGCTTGFQNLLVAPGAETQILAFLLEILQRETLDCAAASSSYSPLLLFLPLFLLFLLLPLLFLRGCPTSADPGAALLGVEFSLLSYALRARRLPAQNWEWPFVKLLVSFLDSCRGKFGVLPVVSFFPKFSANL